MLEAEWASEAEEKRVDLMIENERVKEGADVLNRFLGAWGSKFQNLEKLAEERKKKLAQLRGSVQQEGLLDDEGKKPVKKGWANEAFNLPDDEAALQQGRDPCMN